MVKLDAVREHIHRPLLAHSAQHMLNLVLIETVQSRQRKALIEPRPAMGAIQRISRSRGPTGFGRTFTISIMINWDTRCTPIRGLHGYHNWGFQDLNSMSTLGLNGGSGGGIDNPARSVSAEWDASSAPGNEGVATNAGQPIQHVHQIQLAQLSYANHRMLEAWTCLNAVSCASIPSPSVALTTALRYSSRLDASTATSLPPGFSSYSGYPTPTVFPAQSGYFPSHNVRPVRVQEIDVDD